MLQKQYTSKPCLCVCMYPMHTRHLVCNNPSFLQLWIIVADLVLLLFFFPYTEFLLSISMHPQPNTKGKKRSGHVRLAYHIVTQNIHAIKSFTIIILSTQHVESLQGLEFYTHIDRVISRLELLHFYFRRPSLIHISSEYLLLIVSHVLTTTRVWMKSLLVNRKYISKVKLCVT